MVELSGFGIVHVLLLMGWIGALVGLSVTISKRQKQGKDVFFEKGSLILTVFLGIFYLLQFTHTFLIIGGIYGASYSNSHMMANPEYYNLKMKN